MLDYLRVQVSIIVQTIFYHLKIPAGTVDKTSSFSLFFGSVRISGYSRKHISHAGQNLPALPESRTSWLRHLPNGEVIDALDGILEILFFFLVESFLMPLNVLLEGRYKLIAL